MEYYKQQIKDTLNDLTADGEETAAEILKRWQDGDTQDDFGNMSGSRFCNRYKAEEALQEAGFPFNEELNDLLKEVGYNCEILDKGPEIIDVILCELIAPTAAAEMLDEREEA